MKDTIICMYEHRVQGGLDNHYHILYIKIMFICIDMSQNVN